eukprot:superscaffoldBa00006963_g22086
MYYQALRQFFERVSWELSYPLLFCSCPDQACAERRRRTIVPSCSHQERHKPNCLELRRTCRSDALCRWRPESCIITGIPQVLRVLTASEGVLSPTVDGSRKEEVTARGLL